VTNKLQPGAALGLIFAIVPWVLVPIAGFFLFFGDGPQDGSDPRDAAAGWYFGATGLMALAGVVLGLVRARNRPGVLIATCVLGGAWVVLAARIVALAITRM
jgi:uncharacterized protein (TIGR03382 family)